MPSSAWFLLFFFLFLALQGVLFAIVSAAIQSARRRRIAARLRPAPEDTPDAPRPERILTRDKPPPPGATFPGSLALFARLERFLLAADVSMRPKRFLLFTATAGLTAFFLAYAFSRALPIALAAMGGVITIPFLALGHRRRKKNETLVRQLPEALDMIVRALRVGQSVDGALLEVSRGCPAPLGPEIRLIHEEMALGLPFISALRNFEARFAQLPDIKLMVTAFVIQHETGGNLTRILDNLSGLIRKRSVLKRQIQALTAEGRSSALVLGVLPLVIGLFFWLVRPDYIQILFVDPVGRKMLAAAALLELLGFLVMRLLTRINP